MATIPVCEKGLPVALAMAELASAMPDEGGYVTWTRRAFGPYWAFQVGWWSWIDSFVDVAVYPALFAEYLRFWIPEMTAVERWLLIVALSCPSSKVPIKRSAISCSKDEPALCSG